MSKCPLRSSNPRCQPPSAFDKDGNPRGWGYGPSDPGSGCWPNVNRDVPNLNGRRVRFHQARAIVQRVQQQTLIRRGEEAFA